MKHTKTVDLGDRTVEIRELTVGELRRMLRESREDISGMTFEDLVLGDGFPALAGHFAAFTSLKPGEFEDLTLAEINKIGAAVKEVNPDFFALVGGLAGLMETLGMPSGALNAAASSSSNSDTGTSLTTDGDSSA